MLRGSPSRTRWYAAWRVDRFSCGFFQTLARIVTHDVTRSFCVSSVLAFGLFGLSGCSEEDDPTPPEVDVTPPGVVTDLRVNRTSSSSVTLNWTSPGDDDFDGRADLYDLRISRNPITAQNFTQGERPEEDVRPLVGGFTETFAFNGLLAETTYYFALRTIDEANNVSEISNVVMATTNEPPDVTAPGTIGEITAQDVTATSLTLRWIAPGDDGNQGAAFGYDIRYLDEPLTEDTWAAGDVVTPTPIPDPAGTIELWPVTGLQPETTYFFAIQTRDEVGNFSEISANLEVTTLP